MIQARLESADDGPTLVFGLNRDDLNALWDGRAVRFELSDVGIKPSIPVIIETQEDAG